MRVAWTLTDVWRAFSANLASFVAPIKRYGFPSTSIIPKRGKSFPVQCVTEESARLSVRDHALVNGSMLISGYALGRKVLIKSFSAYIEDIDRKNIAVVLIRIWTNFMNLIQIKCEGTFKLNYYILTSIKNTVAEYYIFVIMLLWWQ